MNKKLPNSEILIQRWIDQALIWREQRNLALAEAEKLKEQRDQAIEIADDLAQRLDNDKYMGSRVQLPIFQELDALKSEIK